MTEKFRLLFFDFIAFQDWSVVESIETRVRDRTIEVTSPFWLIRGMPSSVW